MAIYPAIYLIKRSNVACENNERLLPAYFDGELDVVRSIEFEEHLKTCP